MPAYTTNYGCISTCGAAFPSIRSQESHILEIPDIAPLEKESLDLGLHYLKDKVADLTYLPQGASPLTHLVYYTTLTEQKSPYTLETHTTVQRSVHSNLYTKR